MSEFNRFFICFCTYRTIKLPAVQEQVSRRKPAPTAKTTQGRAASGRGRARTRGTLREIKESIAANKGEPLSSDPPIINEEDDDTEETETETETPKQKENVSERLKKNQTARRGMPFARSRGIIRKSPVKAFSINLSNVCVDNKTCVGGRNIRVKVRKEEQNEEVKKDEDKQEDRSSGEKKAEMDVDVEKIDEKNIDKVKDGEQEMEGIEVPLEKDDKDDTVGKPTEKSFEAATMTAYVNNSEIVKSETNQCEDNTEVKKTDEDNSAGAIESEEDKKHRIDVIGQSLTISKLEDQLDSELKNKFAVKDAEERIRRLQHVLSLLQGANLESDTQNQKSEEEKGTVESESSESSESSDDNAEKTEPEKGESEGQNVNSHEAMSIDENKSEEEGKEDSVVSDVTSKDKNLASIVRKSKEEKGTVEIDEKEEKHVRFEFLPQDEEEENELSDAFQIKVEVGNLVNRVMLMDEHGIDGTDERHRIDKFYVEFPSSQTRAPEIIQRLKDEDEKNTTYSPETEDITDDEDEKNRKDASEKQDSEENEIRKIDLEQSEKDQPDEEPDRSENDEKKSEEIKKPHQVDEIVETSTNRGKEEDNVLDLSTNEKDQIRKKTENDDLVSKKEEITTGKKDIEEDEGIEKEKVEEKEDSKKEEKEDSEKEKMEEEEEDSEKNKVEEGDSEKKKVDEEDAETEKMEEHTEKKKVEDENSENNTLKQEEDSVNNDINLEKEDESTSTDIRKNSGNEGDVCDNVKKEDEEKIKDQEEHSSEEGKKPEETTEKEEGKEDESGVCDNEENNEIHKKDDDAGLIYVESGSDFEENLSEKWKSLTPGTVLKR